MRIVVMSAFFPPAHLAGGPVQTLGAMVSSAPSNVTVDVITSGGDLGKRDSLSVPLDSWSAWAGANVYYSRHGVRSAFRALWNYRRQRPDYIYVNSFFDVRYSLLPQVMTRLGLFGTARLALAPRGEFSPGALALKAKKKKSYLAVHKLLSLDRRILWHASSEAEACDIRAVVGEKAQIVVRMNDTQLPERATRRSEISSGVCNLVFASRLTPKKRLDLLLRALLLVEGDFKLRIVGAFEKVDYEKECRSIVESTLLRERVDFLGPCERSGVLAEFARADAFVFPTAGENFGHVIAEAMSQACPVIASDHTPWSSTIRMGGVVVPEHLDNPRGFASALDDFISRRPEGWTLASHATAEAYDRWSQEDRGPHLFDLLQSYL